MKNKLNEYNKIILLGAGCMAERLYNQIPDSSKRLIGVIDLLDKEKRKITSFHGLKVGSPLDYEDELKNGAALVVAIGTIDVYKYVKEYINKYKFDTSNIFVANPYSSLRFFMVNDEFSSEERNKDENKISLVRDMFSDDESIKILELLCSSKPYESAEDEYELIKYDDIRDFYFYSEDYWLTYPFNNNICNEGTVIDCGAYIGDSVEDVCEAIPEKEIYYYAFEPLHENVELMDKNARFKELCKEFITFEYGVGEKDEILRFGVNDSNLDGGRFISEDKSEDFSDVLSLDIRSLDGLDLEVKGQLYIKMDIEGSELAALKGAKHLIEQKRPYLAICLYHRKNDYIEIPLYLKNSLNNYDFYLRGGYHTILWAIPR